MNLELQVVCKQTDVGSRELNLGPLEDQYTSELSLQLQTKEILILIPRLPSQMWCHMPIISAREVEAEAGGSRIQDLSQLHR